MLALSLSFVQRRRVNSNNEHYQATWDEPDTERVYFRWSCAKLPTMNAFTHWPRTFIPKPAIIARTWYYTKQIVNH